MGEVKTENHQGKRLFVYKHGSEKGEKQVHIVFTGIEVWDHGISGRDYDKVWNLSSDKEYTQFGRGASETSVLLVRNDGNYHLTFSRSREVFVDVKIPKEDGEKLANLV